MEHVKLKHKTALKELAKKAGPYPQAAGKIQNTSDRLRMPNDVRSFVRLFPQDITFLDEEDFLTRSEELSMLIEEERKMPEENLRSPQD